MLFFQPNEIWLKNLVFEKTNFGFEAKVVYFKNNGVKNFMFSFQKRLFFKPNGIFERTKLNLIAN